MKRRTWVLLLATMMMVFCLTACGGGDDQANDADDGQGVENDVEGDQGDADDDAEIPAERTEDAMRAVFTLAYAGMDEEENCYYLATDDEVSFAALVIMSADGAQSMNAVGYVIEDGSYLTINDTYSGYSLTFNVEPAEGGLILTMDDGTEVAAGPVDVDTVIQMIRAIDAGTEIINPLEGDDPAVVSYDEALYAETEAGDAVLLLNTSTGDYSALAMINGDGTLAAVYVGPSSLDDEYLMTVTDSASGETFQSYLIPSEDESGERFALLTTDGETGFAMYTMDVEEAYTAMINLGVIE